jgi:hypothetical protein
MKNRRERQKLGLTDTEIEEYEAKLKLKLRIIAIGYKVLRRERIRGTAAARDELKANA